MHFRDAVARRPVCGARQQVGAWRGCRQVESVPVVVAAGADGVIEREHLLQNHKLQHVGTVAIRPRDFDGTGDSDGSEGVCQVVESVQRVVLALAHGVVVNDVEAFVDDELGIDGGTVYAIFIGHEDGHGNSVSAGSGVVVGLMHPMMGVVTIAEAPYHAVAGIVDGGIEGDVFVRTEVVVL